MNNFVYIRHGRTVERSPDGGSPAGGVPGPGVPFRIRPARPQDEAVLVANICQICAETIYLASDTFVPTESWRSALACPVDETAGSLLIVAEVDGAPAGDLAGLPEASPAEEAGAPGLDAPGALPTVVSGESAGGGSTFSAAAGDAAPAAGPAASVVGHLRLFPPWNGPKSRHVGQIGLAILRPWRERGIGTAVLSYALDWAAGAGFAKLEAEVFATNARALHLFRKFGFRTEAVRARQYLVQGAYVDEVCLCRFV